MNKVRETYAHVKAQDAHVTQRRRMVPVELLLIAGAVLIAIALLTNLLAIRLTEMLELSARLDVMADYEVYWEWRR